jgi:hypothetical protein
MHFGSHDSFPRPPARPLLAKAWALIGLSLGVASLQASEPTGAREYAVKAAFLYNFTKFVEWPAECFRAPDAPFVIGVLECEPLHTELEKAVRGRKVNGRNVVVQHYRHASEIAAPHALFVGGAEASNRDILKRLEARSVLAVGESAAFLELGGTIGFVFEDDKIRFVIDMSAAKRARLKVSAQLQKLAQEIRHKE